MSITRVCWVLIFHFPSMYTLWWLPYVWPPYILNHLCFVTYLRTVSPTCYSQLSACPTLSLAIEVYRVLMERRAYSLLVHWTMCRNRKEVPVAGGLDSTPIWDRVEMWRTLSWDYESHTINKRLLLSPLLLPPSSTQSKTVSQNLLFTWHSTC